jgi:hypothetical protein
VLASSWLCLVFFSFQDLHSNFIASVDRDKQVYIVYLGHPPASTDVSSEPEGFSAIGHDHKVCHQIPLCKKKIPITSKYWHMHEVLNVDEIKN